MRGVSPTLKMGKQAHTDLAGGLSTNLQDQGRVSEHDMQSLAFSSSLLCIVMAAVSAEQ